LELSLPSGKAVNPMHERIESFLADVLALEGENASAMREGVRVHALCRARVFGEIRRRKRPQTT
jgi:hypothetical protein